MIVSKIHCTLCIIHCVCVCVRGICRMLNRALQVITMIYIVGAVKRSIIMDALLRKIHTLCSTEQ